MTLPNFLVIGAMKAGTTSLYQYLASHPEVFMSTPKELHFFSWKAGSDLDWYQQHFASTGRAIAVGEASATYTTYPDAEGAAARIAEVVPDARLVYLVRHPIDRMRSHYLHLVSRGEERVPIDQALIVNPVYLRTSRYAERIEQYLHHFPREQILIVQSERLLTARGETMRQIYRFIGADDSWVPSTLEQEFHRTSGKSMPRSGVQPLRRNPHAMKLARHLPDSSVKLVRRIIRRPIEPDRGQINQDLRTQLENLVRTDVRRLRALLGEGFDGWGIA
jgi:hypothetical protein